MIVALSAKLDILLLDAHRTTGCGRTVAAADVAVVPFAVVAHGVDAAVTVDLEAVELDIEF